MKKFLLLFIYFTLYENISLAQQHSEMAVKSVIDQLFDGIRGNDSLLIKATFHEGCTLQTIQNNKEGRVVLNKSNMTAFITAVGTKREGKQLDERVSSYDIKIDGDMAIAWTPYSFYISDVFSHCGVNAFTLIYQSNKWKILSITDTRRKNDCK
jgi:hypothetical protein